MAVTRSPLWIAGLALALSLSSGCALFEIKKQQEELARIARIKGTVRTESESDRPMVVVLAQQRGDDPDDPASWAIVDYIVRERPGGFAFGVREGRYRVGAFEDLNNNLEYDSHEPVVRLLGSRILDLQWGALDADNDLFIRSGSGIEVENALNIVEAVDKSTEKQHVVTLRGLIVRGVVTKLSDPRFAHENGTRGLWKPADFLMDLKPGVYFLEEYRPDRIPVLFVHGINGTPTDLAPEIESLDLDRFQPWVWFYPSGLSLHGIAQALVWVMTDLQARHGFDQIAVVAHSMGGLVSRSFLLQLEEASGTLRVPLFISIDSPFGGSAAAQTGANQFGKMPPGMSLPASFLDMATKSEFLSDLFFIHEEAGVVRPLPPGVRHHMIFGFKRDSSSFGESSDGTVDVYSQLRPEAQAQASSLLGVNATHVGTLSEKVTIDRVNALLAGAFE